MTPAPVHTQTQTQTCTYTHSDLVLVHTVLFDTCLDGLFVVASSLCLVQDQDVGLIYKP